MFSEIDIKRIIVKYRSLKLDLFNNLRNKKGLVLKQKTPIARGLTLTDLTWSRLQM